jgi:hypothetical protein
MTKEFSSDKIKVTDKSKDEEEKTMNDLNYDKKNKENEDIHDLTHNNIKNCHIKFNVLAKDSL